MGCSCLRSFVDRGSHGQPCGTVGTELMAVWISGAARFTPQPCAGAACACWGMLKAIHMTATNIAKTADRTTPTSRETASGFRTVLLPRFAVETIMRVQINARSNPWDVVCPSSTGTLRDPHNVRRQWREARGDAFAWVTPHSFRKTVATLIHRERGDHDASAQLGHSGTAVTRKHYIERAAEAPDLTAVLNQLG